MATEIRCTYCLLGKPAASFKQQGDHVIPASLGGAWVDDEVCDECNEAANRAADQLIASDTLVRFLRDAYRIRDRFGPRPPCRFSVRGPAGGVVKVTLAEDGATFEAGMAPEVLEGLCLQHPPAQARACAARRRRARP